MKKFAYMLAALSLCAVSFVACDDDNDTNNNPEQPTVECNSNDDCKDNAEGKIECNSSKKCDFPSDDDSCDMATYKPQCDNGDAWVCKDSKLSKEACGEGKECKEGQGCVEKHEEGGCVTNEDCASLGADYVCNASYQCEKKAAEAKDPCAGVKCAAGSCDRGICVTDEMKALEIGSSCDPATFQSFCIGDKTMECNGKIVSDNCADNIGKCTVVENVGKKYAACSGNEDMLARCAANEASDAPKATINVCYGSQDWAAEVFCTTDLAGNPSIFVKSMPLDCKGKACNYGEDDAPVCAE